MHLLKAQAGDITDGLEPVDLEQSPADIIFLSCADTELAMVARAAQNSEYSASLRVANLMQLGHNYSVDLYIEKTLSKAQLIIIRLLGGVAYWPYGLDEITRLARAKGVKLAVMPGDSQQDDALKSYNTLDQHHCDQLWHYLVEGGMDNISGFLAYGNALLETGNALPTPARPLPKLAVLAVSKPAEPAQSKGIAAIIFYRALVQSDDLAPIKELIKSLQKQALTPLPIYVTSLKDAQVTNQLETLLEQHRPNIIINLTGFALSKPALLQDSQWQGTILDKTGAPILQAILSGINQQGWQESARGLGARDIAMNVALPEIDGRILSRAISFKAQRAFDDNTQSAEVYHKPLQSRIDFVAELASNWSHLNQSNNKDKKIAIVMANYPSAQGRMANGVGLDTPQSTLNVLHQMQQRGYTLEHIPPSSSALMGLVSATKDKATPQTSTERRWQRKQSLALHHYQSFFDTLSPCLQKQITERWGTPEEDPVFCETEQSFHLDIHLSGHIAVGFQPARIFKRDGFEGDEKQAHHDMELVPPHSYLAFYAFLRHHFKMDAIIHMGKHGNLEWLPGKALGLSKDCLPEVVLGATPHIYPFIVNDPGEGTQAKRRTSAVIIDHLTPPLTRVESYGALRDLEALVDEYYEAASLDPRRTEILGQKIINMARSTGIDKDCDIAQREEQQSALAKLDNFLCDLKDMQIRDGLHIFGSTPEDLLHDQLVLALTRIRRGDGQDGNASLITALAHDLDLGGFDPLNCVPSQKWDGLRPDILRHICSQTWRSQSDCIERLETLALALIKGEILVAKNWDKTQLVMQEIESNVKPRLAQCGQEEMDNLFTALNGKFVPPGASGAPTRGRLDVLPTGRNFYSLDSRTVPTQSAWELGWLSAQKLVTAYLQEHGDWPRQFGITAWGTANMRTGGDDIAQALALMGVKPVWENNARRVTGFEIIPLSELGRPRIDIMLRISGFFRDAFPVQLDLLDSAIQAVAMLDEPDDMNPLAADFKALKDQKSSLNRIFGSAPGQYGSGLEELLTNRAEVSPEKLAQTYLKSGSFAYGGGKEGQYSEDFKRLLKKVDAVVQNQDAREFDILDSDAFAAYEGGMSIAVKAQKGQNPAIYHNDHANPQNPVIRTLQEEISKIVRARAANPQWIEGIKRHSYKGGSDMAQTVHNLLSMAQTTGLVQNDHFELIFESYLVDPDTLAFLQEHNPDALRDIAQSLTIAKQQNFWYPHRNSAHDFLDELLNPKEKPNV